MFTPNEMITAISNTPANFDLENRFERADFAAYLADAYGSEGYPEDAAECLDWLRGGQVWYEDGPITYFTRDLIEFRAEAGR